MSGRALYVCGSCLFRNTSANMSHHGFVRGLVGNGFEVDVLMPSESFGPLDPGLPRVSGVRYHLHSGSTIRDAVIARAKGWFDRDPAETPDAGGASGAAPPDGEGASWRARLRHVAAGAQAARRARDPHWPSRAWLRRAARFSAPRPFDIVLSNSSPASGHRLAATLLASGRVTADRWLQVWEDPWYHDVYRKGAAPGVLEEEASLLRAADEVFYVSPLTLEYQRKHFPDAAAKMGMVPLPAFPARMADRTERKTPPVFGYFGDFYSHTRDLSPLFGALRRVGALAEVCGDSDLGVESTDLLHVRGRVKLSVLAEVEKRVDVLVAVCNVAGGQVPGKIYHYAATDKPVLLVLDGSSYERGVIRDHFGPLGRFQFCENEAGSIEAALRGFVEGRLPLWARPEPSFEAGAVVALLVGGRR